MNNPHWASQENYHTMMLFLMIILGLGHDLNEKHQEFWVLISSTGPKQYTEEGCEHWYCDDECTSLGAAEDWVNGQAKF